jgi:hypothetical protein
VVDVGFRAGYAPVVQDGHTLIAQRIEQLAECSVAVGAERPGGSRGWIVAQGEDDAAQPAEARANRLFAAIVSSAPLARRRATRLVPLYRVGSS